MRPFFVSLILALGPITACSSSDSGSSKQAPINCDDASLTAKRTGNTFGPGSLAKDTVGSCTGSRIPIEHIVIIMQENRSFDHYYGHLKGNGQNDVDVPATAPTNPNPVAAGAPIAWHHEPDYCVEDTDHGWTASHQQYDDGKMDGFTTSNVTVADPSGHRAMGYYEQTDLPFYYQLSSTFAISDRYFCSLLGPTYPNRMFSTAGTSFGIITTKTSKLGPPGVQQIYKALSDAGVTWRDYYYDLPSPLLYPDYLTYIRNNHPEYLVTSDPPGADGGPGLTPYEKFARDAASGNLAQVSFIDASFNETADVETDEHPPADMQLGQHMVWTVLSSVLKSPLWPKTAVFITYDEHGGLFDHVPPPSAVVPDSYVPDPTETPGTYTFDRLGFRVPLIVVSPYAKRHFVSHVDHSHTSLLRFLEARFEIPAFTKRDANSDALFDLFDFNAPPNLAVPTFDEPPIDAAQRALCKTRKF